MRISDWSSDVCSSDLRIAILPWAECQAIAEAGRRERRRIPGAAAEVAVAARAPERGALPGRERAIDGELAREQSFDGRLRCLDPRVLGTVDRKRGGEGKR